MKNHYISTFRITLSVFTALLAGAVYSCTSPDKEPAALSIEPSVTSMVFSVDGKTATANGQEISAAFEVTTNQDEWSVELSEKDSWLSADKDGDRFTLSAEANEGFDVRGPITVTVKSGEAGPVTINVTQAAGEKPALTGVAISVTVFESPWHDESVGYYWMDGNLTSLPGSNAVAYKIASSGSDIYVSGVVFDEDYNGLPVYWKNGQAINLPVSSEEANTVAIVESDGDIYIAGQEKEGAPLIWKNGELISRIAVNKEVEVGDMAVSGTDVYLAATEWDWYSDEQSAVYWKNGVKTVIAEDAAAIAIEISGNDIYICGGIIENDAVKLVYWKNGELNILWDAGDTEFEPSGMAVSGTDVYVCGYVEIAGVDTAVYWKNGDLVILSGAGEYASAYDMVVDGEDVYVVGEVINGLVGTAVYWKNGVRYDLTNTGFAIATGITLL